MGIGFNPNQRVSSQKSDKAKKKGKVKGKALRMDSGEDMETLKDALDDLDQQLKENF